MKAKTENRFLRHPGDVISRWLEARKEGHLCADCPSEVRFACAHNSSIYHDKCFMAWVLLHPDEAYITNSNKKYTVKDYGIGSIDRYLEDTFEMSYHLKNIFSIHLVKTVGDLLSKNMREMSRWNGVGVKTCEEIKVLVEKIKSIRSTYDTIRKENNA